MHKQTVQFATVVKNGVVERIGRSSVYVPKTNFKGGSIKWYEDKPTNKVGTWKELSQWTSNSLIYCNHIVKTICDY